MSGITFQKSISEFRNVISGVLIEIPRLCQQLTSWAPYKQFSVWDVASVLGAELKTLGILLWISHSDSCYVEPKYLKLCLSTPLQNQKYLSIETRKCLSLSYFITAGPCKSNPRHWGLDVGPPSTIQTFCYLVTLMTWTILLALLRLLTNFFLPLWALRLTKILLRNIKY